MKKIKLIFVLFTSIVLGQNYNTEFLDGTIVFKLNQFVEVGRTEKIQNFSVLQMMITNESSWRSTMKTPFFRREKDLAVVLKR